VCAGGGVTGAVYEIGCLRALAEVLDRPVTDFDLYVGISGGAFVSSLLASGVSPEEMYDEVTSRTRSPFGVAAAPLYRLGPLEFVKRSLRAPSVLARAVMTTLAGEGRNLADFGWALFELLPPGLLDTVGIQQYLKRFFAARKMADRFDAMNHDLYVVAVDLDSGEAVAFGEEGHRDVPVSKAVQASAALPGLYRPVRIGGRDYVDGGVKKTAHINLAIRHGADLVICINPLVPIRNDTSHGPLHGHLSNRGVTWVLDQAMRIMLHGRMQYGLERYRREHPEVDILLIEPTRDDVRMFLQHHAYSAPGRGGHGYAHTSRPAGPEGRVARMRRKHGLRLIPRLPPARPSTPIGRASRRRSGPPDHLSSRLRRGSSPTESSFPAGAFRRALTGPAPFLLRPRQQPSPKLAGSLALIHTLPA
jgi:predicted acylesterase/phospholipase RssA